MPQNLDAFIAKWAAAGAAERANKDSFLNELCDVLEVARPNPTVRDPERDSYVFERKVPLVHEDSEATQGSIDLYKQDGSLWDIRAELLDLQAVAAAPHLEAGEDDAEVLA